MLEFDSQEVPVEEEASDEEKVVVEEPAEEKVEEPVEEPKPKPKKKRRLSQKKKKEEIPLESIDRHLQPKEEKPEFSGRTPIIPESDAQFPPGTDIVDAALATKMLRDTNFRRRLTSDRVAYLGRGKQKWFVLEMTSWRVTSGGILFVPAPMAGFSLLKSWERLEGEAPKGFVAFKAQ
jgi:hypothetical protein